MKFFPTKYGFLLFLLLFGNLFAQYPDVKKGSFFFPRVLDDKEYIHEFSVILAKLPEDQIEATSAWIYAPLFTYHAKYGLPENFALKGEISTNVITFFFKGGVRWNFDAGDFSFGAGFDAAYWRGALKQFGFNSKVNAWNGFASLSVGYAAEKFAFTIAAETNYLFSIEQAADDIVTESEKTALIENSVSVYVEQPVWKDNFMTLGVKVNFSKIYWPAWAVFPSWDKYFTIPEVFIGFVL